MGFNRLQPYNDLPPLTALGVNFESIEILRHLSRASRALGELKGFCDALPCCGIFTDLLALKEARDSTAIEDIFPTTDELYAALISGAGSDGPAEQVIAYRDALLLRWNKWKMPATQNLGADLVETVHLITGQNFPVREGQEKVVRNPANGVVIYTAPRGYGVLEDKLQQLEAFITNSTLSSLDPLIKLSLIHYQFEAIHPFTTANGRVGRIINSVYLGRQGLISYPVLNLSGYLRRYKTAYFQALQQVTDGRRWLEWTVFLLDGIYESARLSLRMLLEMQALRKQLERHLPQQPNSGELLRVLLGFPYLTEEFLQRQKLYPGPLSRLSGDLMSTYLYEQRGMGNTLTYINRRLVDILETS